jgi:hypothetical protein
MKGGKIMAMKRHPNHTELVRFSACIQPKTRELLDEYAYQTRQTVSVAIDTLLHDGAAAFLGGDEVLATGARATGD